MSYKRAREPDEDEEPVDKQLTSSDPVSIVLTPSSLPPPSTSINKADDSPTDAPREAEHVRTSKPATDDTTSSPEVVQLDDSPTKPIQQYHKRQKIDYSRWTAVPRPPPETNADIERFIAWMQSGKSINTNLRQSKEFHNPSILIGLVEMCGIQEKGSNIPKEKSGRLSFLPSDHHHALIKAQEQRLAERVAYQQSGRRTHIDFVKRPAADASADAPSAKRFKR